MADADLGQKRACPSCSGKFYDLTKVPAVCPYCGATFNPDDLIRGRNRKPAPQEETKEKAPEKPAKNDGDDDAEVEDGVKLPTDIEEVDDDGDEDDDVLEDASDLGEDDSDLGEVMEHVEKPEKEG